MFKLSQLTRITKIVRYGVFNLSRNHLAIVQMLPSFGNFALYTVLVVVLDANL